MLFLNKKYSYSKLKYHLTNLILALVYWNIVIRLAIFLRILGNKSDRVSEVLSDGIEFVTDQVFFSSLIISLYAMLSWYGRTFVYSNLIKRYHVRRLAIVVVLMDTMVFIIVAIMLGWVHYVVEENQTIFQSVIALKNFLFNSTILFFLIVLSIGSYINQLFYTVFHQIGFYRFGRIMVGYYQKPREENLIFMFLDLKSSTAFAEKLGHERYSDFIQDCFKFLSNPLLLTYGNIYQFVGDEVIVTWSANKSNNYKKAVDFFFLFINELNAQKDYFEKKYELTPVFTASINAGKVMAAEVGEIRRELAFHGDVLNTAARIQKQCKKYHKDILVTQSFAEELKKYKNGYCINYLDKVKLVGKVNKVALFDVSKSTN